MRFARIALTAGVAALAALPALADGIQVGATLEANYTYNANKPSTGRNGALGAPYYFNSREGGVLLNLAELHIFQDPSEKKAVGFSVRLVDGEVVSGLPLNLSGVNSTTQHLYEAYIRTVRSVGEKPLTIDAGLFPTWVGYETIPVGASNFFSKSFHFGQFQPFYHSGVRAAWAASAKTTVTGAIVNRYNGSDTNGNRDLGAGFQVAQTLSGGASVYFNAFTARDSFSAPTGNEGESATVEKPKSIVNVVYTGKAGSTGIALDASAVTGKNGSGKSFNAQGVTGYLTHAVGAGTVALRAEMLTENTKGGQLLPSASSGKKPTLSSVTLSYEPRPIAPGARTLVELRFDSANTAVFPGEKADKAKKNGTTFTVAQIVTF